MYLLIPYGRYENLDNIDDSYISYNHGEADLSHDHHQDTENITLFDRFDSHQIDAGHFNQFERENKRKKRLSNLSPILHHGRIQALPLLVLIWLHIFSNGLDPCITVEVYLLIKSDHEQNPGFTHVTVGSMLTNCKDLVRHLLLSLNAN
ncbi:hypothetical protein L1987_35512 [Smallanthus sonchifolius]|uniref:Uncharacterized protein n=1 Tax=Smallanthus sonchifolius TaxID=185202 RepID=A0ACB9HZG5_9ASTR|nr:hypothetical protein L1987_35512 [Smallanthus sonchifolius]